MPAMSSAIQARSTSMSDGRIANPMNTSSGKRDEPGEPLEHDRRERDRRGVDRGRGPRHAQHVAADRRRQDVADELAREVVPDQRAERHACVEHEAAPAASARPTGPRRAAVMSSAAPSSRAVRRWCRFGRSSSGLGALSTSTPRRATLTRMRAQNFHPGAVPGDDRSAVTHGRTAYVGPLGARSAAVPRRTSGGRRVA